MSTWVIKPCSLCHSKCIWTVFIFTLIVAVLLWIMQNMKAHLCIKYAKTVNRTSTDAGNLINMGALSIYINLLIYWCRNDVWTLEHWWCYMCIGISNCHRTVVINCWQIISFVRSVSVYNQRYLYSHWCPSSCPFGCAWDVQISIYLFLLNKAIRYTLY